jgi:hypothetical protein
MIHKPCLHTTLYSAVSVKCVQSIEIGYSAELTLLYTRTFYTPHRLAQKDLHIGLAPYKSAGKCMVCTCIAAYMQSTYIENEPVDLTQCE